MQDYQAAAGKKRKGLRSDCVPRPHSGTLNSSFSIHPFTSSPIHHLFLETAWVPGPVRGSEEPDINLVSDLEVLSIEKDILKRIYWGGGGDRFPGRRGKRTSEEV